MSVPDLFTVDDLADRWGVNHKTVRAMIERGEVRCFRVGRHIRITAEAVRECEGWNSGSSCTEASTQPNGAKEASNTAGRFVPQIVASPFSA